MYLTIFTKGTEILFGFKKLTLFELALTLIWVMISNMTSEFFLSHQFFLYRLPKKFLKKGKKYEQLFCSYNIEGILVLSVKLYGS